jgi:hypothetical protein
MTNRELFSFPILLPSTAKVGKYSKGNAYRTQWGLIYTFQHESGLVFRISRAGVLQLHTKNGKYADTTVEEERKTYRVRREFTVLEVKPSAVYVDEIFNRPM